MKLAENNLARLTGPHCCVCNSEGGSFCCHIGPISLCGRHSQPTRQARFCPCCGQPVNVSS